MKKVLSFYLLIIFFFTSFFSVFAQVEELFPYKLDLTDKERKLLNSLDKKTLEKFLQVAKTLLQKNSLNTNNVATSSSYSARTPYYNPQTGQYQSTPPQNQQQNQISPEQESGGGGGAGTNAFLSAVNRGADPFSGVGQSGTFEGKGCPATIPAFCESNLGVDVTGSCSEKHLTTPPVSQKLAKDLKCVCAILGRRIQSASVYRNESQQRCANPKVKSSQHTAGTAIDVSYGTMSTQEALKVFFYFKSNGYRHGCYGGKTSHVHFDHGGGPNYYEGPCPAQFSSVIR